ncbi:MAG: hypothetical protein B0D96_00075 [Candidatus Sedimenticola endophacoides]|nr:MAG: hypothetical protein B0D94_00265 [Candidatus Sedimenticola endophacoides]OQX38536.1 MAG: hypothetical protein B0D96_00075 [Candidatus Sedimenticola endophacoides]OQX43063.1 MAG: hypothetical protein B0D89_00045 [Candidatus Sedimenticola endophacoides]OQX43632.1 MAG: hypothetical protein B0D83_01045 [Candidatus Sedimenticola endophacoides]OQX47753.1 MAG: hypothetical protein B0D85_00620 [Candidatus Sedimenticola endophacoides]
MGKSHITKPFSPPIIEARIANHLTLKDHRDNLEGLVAARTRELQLIKDATVQSLAALAEARDRETGNHIRRTQHYVRALAEQLARNPRYREQLDEATIERLFKTAPLHDIGKVGVPDAILQKPGKLSSEEFEVMKHHPRLGREAMREASEMMLASGCGDDFFHCAGEIAGTHHEKWDGSGYPDGLSGGQIPLPGRLMAVADVYDALISTRAYKSAMDWDQVRDHIVGGRGSHFDPDCVDAFLDAEEEFRAIAERYRDGGG